MNQLTQGTVTVTNGSATVTGVGTNFLQATPGESFFVAAGDNVVYTVAGIASNTSLTLSSPFQGTSASGIGYIIHVEIIDGLPLFTPADADTALLMNEVVKRVVEHGGRIAGLEATEAGLGTAATADVTTSNTDTNTSRVMRPGNFGLGNIISTPTLESTAQEIPTGFYRAGTDRSEFPIDTPSAHIIHLRRVSAGGEFQFFIRDDADVIFFRRRAIGSWSPWQQLYHTGNLGESDTAWTTVTSLDNGWTGTVRYIKRGGMVTVVAEALNGSSATSDNILVLPSDYRASVEMRGILSRGEVNSNRIRITTGGVLSLFGTRDTNHRGSIAYPVLP